ncbi:hypothetical protein GWK47_035209 [Chionoecetes opilio]|uniref:MARVEL domain-containing protein n=1 Tax=Chionoecetes opilio TaxID=41210 RepID=A0A8J4YFR1_CHIOP|nr:hypothetical protein GWK47_035209 [Chionoecetes opilio]
MATVGTRPSIDRIREPAALIKLPEIVLLLIALITFCVHNNGSLAYVLSVLLPSLLNALLFLTVQLLGYDQLRETPVELVLYSYNILAFFISAILLMSRHDPTLIASGVFCLLLVIIYCMEVYLAYTSLSYRPSLPSAPSASPSAEQQPAVISSANFGVYPAVTSHPRPADGVDTGVMCMVPELDLANPVYPGTLNYPPYPLPEHHNTPFDIPVGPMP